MILIQTFPQFSWDQKEEGMVVALQPLAALLRTLPTVLSEPELTVQWTFYLPRLMMKICHTNLV
jgi:hypothetical protein